MHAVVRATLDEAVVQCTVETEVPGRYFVDEEKCTDRVTVPITCQQQHLVRRGPALWKLAFCAQFQAVEKSQQVSLQLQRAIRLFTEHAEQVAGLVVSSKKLMIITNDERIRDVPANVMAMRAKRFRVKMTFLKRLRQAGANGSNMTDMPLAQLNEARLIAPNICREKTCHRCLDLDLMLEFAGTDPVQRLRSSCGNVLVSNAGSLHCG